MTSMQSQGPSSFSRVSASTLAPGYTEEQFVDRFLEKIRKRSVWQSCQTKDEQRISVNMKVPSFLCGCPKTQPGRAPNAESYATAEDFWLDRADLTIIHSVCRRPHGTVRKDQLPDALQKAMVPSWLRSPQW